MNPISIVNNYWILIPLIIWTFIWKGIALWKSSRRGEKIWFVILLVLNTLGILEIIYIFFVTRKKTTEIQFDNIKKEDLAKKKMV
jgi:methionyl-tRNA synthetase